MPCSARPPRSDPVGVAAIRRELVGGPPPATAGLESVAPRDDVVAKQKPNKPVLGVALVVHATALTLTWRNLRNRPAGQVRGSKTLWRIASALNTLGSVAYWLFGRRPVR
jgi:hypothetical protein